MDWGFIGIVVHPRWSYRPGPEMVHRAVVGEPYDELPRERAPRKEVYGRR